MSVFDNDESVNQPIDIFAQVSLESTQDDFVYKELEDDVTIAQTSAVVDEVPETTPDTPPVENDFHNQFVDNALSVLEGNSDPTDDQSIAEPLSDPTGFHEAMKGKLDPASDGNEIYNEIANNFVKMMNGEIPPGTVSKESHSTVTDGSHAEMVQESVTENQVNDLITDTPLNPSEEPPLGQEDAERYISMEDDPEITESVEALDALLAVHNELVDLGGISQTQVASIEAMHPGLIPNGDKPQYFSSRTSPTGYRVSLESIAKKIVDKVVAIFKYIADRLKAIANRVRNLKPERTLADNVKGWEDVVSKAKKADANNGALRLREIMKNEPIAMKSGNVLHYIKLYCNDQLSKQSGNWCVGFDNIMQGGDLNSDLAKLVTSAISASNDVKANIAKFQGNQYNISSITDEVGNLDDKVHRVKAQFGAASRIRDANFEKMINVDSTTFDKTIGAAIGLTKTVEDLEKTVQRIVKQIREDNIDAKSKAAKELNVQTGILNKYISLMDVYLKVYARYIKMQKYILGLAHAQIARFGVFIN